MKTITLNKIKYVLCDDIMLEAPIFSKKCRNTRELIKKKNISNDDYLYARLSKETNKWIKSNGKSIKYDKIFIKESYLENISELGDEEEIKDEDGIMLAPDIIELEDNEKFQDDDGNILDIETRGTRKCNNIYFKVKDVEKLFLMKSLYTTIIGKKNRYTEKIDYIFFNCKKLSIGQKKTKKELFLTYEGILRLLFISKNKKCQKFIKWATETLFTIQMGTKDQKQYLSSKILGVSAKAVKEVFKTSSKTIPCIYLFSLNTVNKLRKKMNIPEKYPDDAIVCKYGFTDSLERRTGEHIKEFVLTKKVNLQLKHYSYIDPQYISNAEVDIKDFFKGLEIGLEYKTHKEIVVIKPELFKIVRKYYTQLTNAYAGHITEMIKKLENERHDKELLKMNHKNELLEEKQKLLIKENEINMLKKDLEIEKMKNELLLLKQK